MCLACIEFLKGNITKAEARKGMREFGGAHDDDVLAVMEDEEIDSSEYWPDYPPTDENL